MKLEVVAGLVRTAPSPTVHVPPFERRERGSPGTWRDGWTSEPAARTALPFPLRYGGPAPLELVEWTGHDLVRVGAVAFPEATACIAVGPDLRVAACDMDWSRDEARPIRIAICEAGRAPIEHMLQLGTGTAWPRALRWTPAGDIVLLLEDDDSLLVLIDPRTGAVLGEADVESAMCDGGWIDAIEGGHVVIHGHCSCQENDFELARLDGRELEALDWMVHTPEGCAVLEVGDTTVLSIENDPTPVVRRRDRATGHILAANVLDDAPGAFGAIRCRTETGHLVLAYGRDRSLVHVDAATLSIDDELELDDAIVPHAFVEPGLLLAECDDRLQLLRVRA